MAFKGDLQRRLQKATFKVALKVALKGALRVALKECLSNVPQGGLKVPQKCFRESPEMTSLFPCLSPITYSSSFLFVFLPHAMFSCLSALFFFVFPFFFPFPSPSFGATRFVSLLTLIVGTIGELSELAVAGTAGGATRGGPAKGVRSKC